MTDLASLGLAIDASQIPPAVAKLDDLTAAGTKAEKAIDRLGDEAAQSGTQIKSASKDAADYAAKVQVMANNTRLTGTHVDTLGKASLTARSSVNRLSSEVGTLAGQLATGSVSAEGMASSLGRITLAAAGISSLIGILGGIAAAAGIVAAAFLGVKQGAEDLTKATVSWGNVAEATFEVIAEKAGTSAGDVKKWFSDAFRAVGEFGKFSVAVIVAAFVSGYRLIGNVWSNLPALVGEAAAGAANLAVTAIEKLANLGIQALNKMAAGINNSLIGKGIQAAFGVQLPTLAAISLGRVQNIFAGTGKKIADNLSADFFGTYKAVQGTFDEISGRAAKLAEADEEAAKKTGKAAGAHRDRAKAANDEADALDRLLALHEKLAAKSLSISDDLLNADALPDEVGLSALPKSFEQLINPAEQLLETMRELADQSQVTADIMQGAFGNVGGVFGGLIEDLANYGAAQAYWAAEIAKDSSKQGVAEKALATLRTKNTGAAISGLKSLFKEHSTGYKVMSAIEKAYAVFQAAQTVAAIARDIAHTTSSLANAATRTTANTAEGGSKIFAQLGMYAFPVVAAMVAVLAALGARGGGGGGGAPPTSAEDLQAQAGTGSVLGDSKAKSDSIARSLELVAENTNHDLEYSNAMLKALRSIDTSIAKMANTVARQIQVAGGLFDTSGQNLGTNSKKGFLGVFGGSTTTRNLYDLGITLRSGSVADIIANGIAGQTYQVIEKIKKKKGFLGIGGSTKTTYSTTNGTIDADIVAAIGDVIRNLRDGLVEASKVIGLEGADALLNSFQVNIGKISFKDMTGEQIEDQLNAIFSKIGDDMAKKLFPALASMQQVGEGLFETFIRVAKEYQAVDVALQSIGRTFGAVGVQSIAARDGLVQLFGGLDEFIEATDFFRENFLTEAEQIAPVQAAVIAEMKRLGVANVTTREQFKTLVLGLDLTTQAGRDMYASLLSVAPAFDKVLDYYDAANKKIADGLQQTIDKFEGFAASLKKYRDTLFQTDASQANAYKLLRMRFLQTASLASEGDATALGGLESAGKAFLDAAKNNASTREQYLRDVATVARGVDQGIFAAETTADYAQLQLDALGNANAFLASIADSVATTASILTDAVVTPAPVGGGQGNVVANSGGVPVPASAGGGKQTASAMTRVMSTSDNLLQALLTEVGALRSEVQAVANNTGSTDRQLKRWDRGDTVAITADTTEPLPVNLVEWS